MRTETKVSQGAIIKNKALKTECQGDRPLIDLEFATVKHKCP